MDNRKDGLSRKDRLNRITSGRPFSVLDNSQESLLQQSLKVAGFLRYYNLFNVADGYFDSMLESLENPETFFGMTRPGVANGEVEPSQALLLIFLENLHKTTQDFNARFRKYPLWYLQDVLKVKHLPLKPNKIWISLEKKPLELVTVKEGTRFVTANKNGRPLYYKVQEDIELLETHVTEGYILNFEKDKKRVPEGDLGFVTALKVKELQIQSKEADTSKHLKTVGIKLTSPALLLREGERTVTVTFYDENNWIDLLVDNYNRFNSYLKENDSALLGKELAELARKRFYGNMFYLSISTTEGWKNIPEYAVDRGKEENTLIVKFVLDESFPATSGCTFEKHKFVCQYPKLNVHLNFDAWMYPYSWMKDFMLYKVKIETEVKDISNIYVYNELGKVDVSKPFPPFGINNEKGAWFAVGNYEMAIKNTKSVDIDIQWRQLPQDDMGLYGYYKQYNSNISNTSFTLQSRFLTDYIWKETPNRSKFYLFSTAGRKEGMPLPDAPLINETRFENIDVEKMPAIKISEEEYEYTSKSRAGFVDFIFETPDMGFGESVYRKLFTEQIMKSARKDQKYPAINPPINPLIERITLSYKAEDVINLHDNMYNEDIAVDSILPIDSLSYFPKSTRKSIPFAVSMEESNLLLALKDVVPGKLFNLFFDFMPSGEEIGEVDIPNVKWYIGNMRKWQLMSPSFVQKDETRRLSVDGRIQFLIPDFIDPLLFDEKGQLWIRGGIEIKEQTVVVPKLQGIYINAVSLELDIDFGENEKIPFKDISAKLEPEKNIPGVNSFKKITSFYDGREYESDSEMLVRVSEYITHQGKAVTPRDYERITLQAFPDIVKVKCYRDPEDNRSSNVYMAVIATGNSPRPLTSNYRMVKIERFLSKLTSAYVANIKVTNPVYEEIMVRAVLKFNGEYLSEARRKLMVQMINHIIAPWQDDEKQLPMFGHSIDLKEIYEAISGKVTSEFIIEDFAVIRIQKNADKYIIHEYTNPNESIVPAKPNVIFVPEKEHILHIEGLDGKYTDKFGINEMKLGDTFIIK